MDYEPAYHIPGPRRTEARVKLERISEPWAIGKVCAVALTLFLAVLFGNWVANGEMTYVALVGMWIVAALIIIFVRDQWWSPALIITSLGISTNIQGVGFSGYEAGIAILAITFPTKMAMKTLRKAEPDMKPGFFFWALLTFVCIHAASTIAYNHIDGVPLKNIVKAYYGVISPLVFYGLMVRYCHARTVKPGCIAIYCCTMLSVLVSMVTILKGIDIEQIGDLSISIDSISQAGALGVLRGGPVLLFTGAIAYWPVVQGARQKLFLLLGILLGIAGVLLGGGRITFATCLLTAVIFAFIRNRIWMAVPGVIAVALLAGISTANPGLIGSLPSSVQRALAPFNFSDQKTEEQDALQGSNDWHQTLRDQSLDYWLMDANSFWFGHGFKAWDASLSEETNGFDFERHVEVAIEMGRTENLISSTTNIFGLVGLTLYIGFIIELGIGLWKGCRVVPVGKSERAICEYSLISIALALVFCLVAGGTPTFLIVYWGLGLVAARPFIAARPMQEKHISPDGAAALPSFIPKDLHRARRA